MTLRHVLTLTGRSAISRLTISLAAAALMAASAAAVGQGHAAHDSSRHHGHGAATDGAAPSSHDPYADWQTREIKALSPQQVDDLQAGRGMSLALPAELNGYPGPAHVLELAEPLVLSTAQRQAVEAAFVAMQRETQALGRQVIDAERALDRLFRDRQADANAITRLTHAAALAQADLRAAHLRYHLDMMSVLASEQVAGYPRLRGY